jgi:hypothetical protein
MNEQGFVMRLLATPDFGAGASLGAILLIVWAVVLVLVMVGLGWGVKLLTSGTAKGRKQGMLLIVVSALIPLLCCLGPPQLVRIGYGNYPIGRYPSNIREGMSANEVLGILGTPHERVREGDSERWYYWIDWVGISWAAVEFGPDGRVISIHGN